MRREWIRVQCPDCGLWEDAPVKVEDRVPCLGQLHISYEVAAVPHKCEGKDAPVPSR